MLFRPSILLFIYFISSTSAQEGNVWKKHYRLDYSYDPAAPNGPDNWAQVKYDNSELYNYVNHGKHNLRIDRGNQCDLTRRQAPLNLFVSEEGHCYETHEMLTRKIKDYDCKENDLTFEITPHSLKAYFPDTDDYCRRPSIDMSNKFRFRWFLTWMELHVRAEHVVDGRRYDAELQMYHLGTEKQDYQAAAVSVLIDASAREDHPQFQWLIDQWQSVRDNMDNGVCRTSKSSVIPSADPTNHETLHPSRSPTDMPSNIPSEAPVGSFNTSAEVGGAEGANVSETASANFSLRTNVGSDTFQTGERKLSKAGRRRRMERLNEHAEIIFEGLSEEEDDLLHYGTAAPTRNRDGRIIQSVDDLRTLRRQVEKRGNTTTMYPGSARTNRNVQEEEDEEDCVADRFGRGCEPLERRNLMFPYNLWPTIHYYGYRGTTTYPPCTDVVQWRILDEPLLISKRQWKALAKLSQSYKNDSCQNDSDLSPKGENVRPLHELGWEQEVWHCTLEKFSYWMYDPLYN